MASTALHNFPQWVSLRQRVSDDLYDESLWSQLVQHHENLVHDHTHLFNSRKDLKSLLYDDFELLFAKFPYYVVYWKRYIQLVSKLEGLKASIQTMERAIHMFPYSLELWVDYVNVLVSNNLKTNEEMKLVFKRGAEYVGQHFVSHEYWDIYLDYILKNDGKNSNDYIDVLLNIIRIPLHQYSRYYESFMELVGNFTIMDLIPSDQLKKFVLENYDKEISVEQHIESSPTEIINAFFYLNFSRVQRLTNEKWKYEAELKKVDFDLNLMSSDELDGWIKYLDFQDTESELSLVDKISLYERALVPSCFLKDVWIKYLRFLIQKNVEKTTIIKVFNRGCDQFVPNDVLDLRYMYAKYLELEVNDINAAKRVYLSTIKKNKTNCDPVYKYLDFIIQKGENKLDIIQDILAAAHSYKKENTMEKQENNDIEKASKKQKPNTTYNTTIHNEDIKELYPLLTYRTIGQLVATAARYYWINNRDVNETRMLLSTFFENDIVKCSREYWFIYFKFEFTQRNKQNLTTIINYIKLYSQLCPNDINILIKQYIDFMFKNLTLEELHSQRRNLHKLMLESDTESSVHEKHYLKFRVSLDHDEESVNKRLFNENGHPAAICEGIPITTNPIPLSESLFSFRQDIPIGIEDSKQLLGSKTVANPLPQFRNVEKANNLLKYIRESI